ncbi:unnamed protein product, partial [Mesorhabditis spiculigera]
MTSIRLAYYCDDEPSWLVTETNMRFRCQKHTFYHWVANFNNRDVFWLGLILGVLSAIIYQLYRCRRLLLLIWLQAVEEAEADADGLMTGLSDPFEMMRRNMEDERILDSDDEQG